MHEWSLRIVQGAGLILVAFTMLAEIIDKAKIIYFKLRNFRKQKDQIPPDGQ